MTKKPFTIGGSVALKKALLEETGAEFRGEFASSWTCLYANKSIKSMLDETYIKLSTHYQLPQDWDKAVKAVKDFFAEEAKPQTLVLKGVKMTQVIDEFTGSEKTVDLHLTAAHLQQLKTILDTITP